MIKITKTKIKEQNYNFPVINFDKWNVGKTFDLYDSGQ